MFSTPLFALVVFSFSLCALPSVAQQGNEKTFATPGDAALDLYNAVKANDTQSILAIFGTNANDIIHTGDDVADKNMGDNFLRRYEQMHRVVIEPDQTATLYIGAENWPFAISIVKNDAGRWYFDTETGKTEILQRRVGTNENDAIEILHGLVDAQLDYASQPRNGDNTKHYALRFLSDEGKQNGLYWKTNDNDAPSPIGPLMVSGTAAGYNIQPGQSAPFHGYYYRILTKQGSAAKGGALDYVVNGKLTRGLCVCGVPGSLPKFRCHDFHREPEWDCLSEGSRSTNLGHGSRHASVRSGQYLGAGRLSHRPLPLCDPLALPARQPLHLVLRNAAPAIAHKLITHAVYGVKMNRPRRIRL